MLFRSLKGFPVILADTAGFREARDAIEAEGIRRARTRAEAADLRLLVRDGTAPEAVVGMPEADLVVWNKADLVPQHGPGLWVSAQTGEGLPELIERLAEQAAKGMGGSEAPALTRARHREALEKASSALERAAITEEPELAAENVRLALTAIGRVTGRVDLDDLLDVVFHDFCIGK